MRPGRTTVAVFLDDFCNEETEPGMVRVVHKGRHVQVPSSQVRPYDAFRVGTVSLPDTPTSRRLEGVSNTLPADPAEVAAAGTGDVTEACADGGRDDCQKPPAGELLGTTTTA